MSKDERTETDKKRARRLKKTKQRQRQREKEKTSKEVAKINPGLGNKYSKLSAEKKLLDVSGSNITKVILIVQYIDLILCRLKSSLWSAWGQNTLNSLIPEEEEVGPLSVIYYHIQFGVCVKLPQLVFGELSLSARKSSTDWFIIDFHACVYFLASLFNYPKVGSAENLKGIHDLTDCGVYICCQWAILLDIAFIGWLSLHVRFLRLG